MPPAPAYASQIAARLDRLPVTRTLWRLVFLISLGGAFELYDIFLSTYIAPGLVGSGMFTSSAADGARSLSPPWSGTRSAPRSWRSRTRPPAWTRGALSPASEWGWSR